MTAARARAVVPRRRPSCLLARRERAQGMVEFALALPIFVMIMAVAMQIAFLLTAQIGIIWVTNSVARHIATGSPENWMFADSCHTTYRNQQLAAFSLLRSSNVTTFTISPAYTPGTVDCTNVAKNVPAATAGTPPARIRGGPIQVTMQYDPSNLFFLPATFFGIPVLRALPAYTASSVME
ncbi:MAG TPA: TadE family protein [Chloroflexota bacterium]|nr:TadE family protein [Chloroflexota bacterium]